MANCPAADVFAALTEDRPYRKGLNPQAVEEIMMACVVDRKLDGDLVNLFLDNRHILLGSNNNRTRTACA